MEVPDSHVNFVIKRPLNYSQSRSYNRMPWTCQLLTLSHGMHIESNGMCGVRLPPVSHLMHACYTVDPITTWFLYKYYS